MKNIFFTFLSPAHWRALLPVLFFSLFSLALPWALWPQEAHREHSASAICRAECSLCCGVFGCAENSMNGV